MGQEYSVPPEEIRSENVTDEVIASLTEKGYTLTFAEEVMHYDISQALPHVVVPFEVSYLSWTPERAHDFFTIYTASFRERPGFPGWDEAEWVHWTSDDPAFRSDLSFLAIARNQAVGFVTTAEYVEAQHGYIIQAGVHPEWRGQGLGSALIIHALQAWQGAGKEAVILDVNVNNPGAIRLYQQLGFVVMRRRGKFSRRTQ
jgi:mycothiol synthase